MKKAVLKIFFLVFLISLFNIFFNSQNSKAYTATFNDFSAIRELDNKYSYGTMFWTEGTQIIPISVPFYSTPNANQETGCYMAFGAEQHQWIKIKITKCAIDEDHDLCDVIMTVKPVKYFQTFNSQNRWTYYIMDGDALRSYEQSGRIIANVLAVKKKFSLENQTISAINSSDLIFFELETLYMESSLTLEYYKTGTEEEANINGVAGFVTNINVPLGYHIETAPLDYSRLLCNSNEAVAPNYNAKIYYDSNSNVVGKSEKENGIYCNGPYKAGNWKDNSCLIVEDEKAKFEILYGGTYCGIEFGFFSPYKYSLPDPKTYVDKTMVYENEEFNTYTSQYIPNDYYSSFINFFGTNSFYSHFEISEQINGITYKSFDLNNVKIFNSFGSDVTSMFNISIYDKNIKAILKSEYLYNVNFYNNIYYLNVPLKYKENDKNKVRRDFSVEGFRNISGNEKSGGIVETFVKMDIKLKKIWNDEENKLGIRPQKIKIDIMK